MVYPSYIFEVVKTEHAAQFMCCPSAWVSYIWIYIENVLDYHLFLLAILKKGNKN